MTIEERLELIKNAPDLYKALDQQMKDLVGHKLFTLMVIDRRTGEAARVYSSNPSSYPVKGRKTLGGMTAWGEHVIENAHAYIGYNANDIKTVFPDYETIYSLDCESVLNVPVLSDGVVIGTVNMLHEANWYQDEHIAIAQPFADLLVPKFLAWADA